ncbi:MAG: hypothetical protein M1816_007558 [Peltula sp. TS41687]|nr:MAG: hypothetical protein M1816_007558 [Peltula sp. TS41687]
MDQPHLSPPTIQRRGAVAKQDSSNPIKVLVRMPLSRAAGGSWVLEQHQLERSMLKEELERERKAHQATKQKADELESAIFSKDEEITMLERQVKELELTQKKHDLQSGRFERQH